MIPNRRLVLIPRHIDHRIRPKQKQTLHQCVHLPFPFRRIAQKRPPVRIVEDAAPLGKKEKRKPCKKPRPRAVTIHHIRPDARDFFPNGTHGGKNLKQASMIRIIRHMIFGKRPRMLRIFLRTNQKILNLRNVRMLQKGGNIRRHAALHIFPDMKNSHAQILRRGICVTCHLSAWQSCPPEMDFSESAPPQWTVSNSDAARYRLLLLYQILLFSFLLSPLDFFPTDRLVSRPPMHPRLRIVFYTSRKM